MHPDTPLASQNGHSRNALRRLCKEKVQTFAVPCGQKRQGRLAGQQQFNVLTGTQRASVELTRGYPPELGEGKRAEGALSAVRIEACSDDHRLVTKSNEDYEDPCY
jgi:hypothetical protein